MDRSHGNGPIALTCGDPSGVGPEVIAAALADVAAANRNVCLVGPASWALPLAEQWAVVAHPVGPDDFECAPGKPSVAGAAVAFEALEAAAAGCREGRFRAVVSGPVSKHWMRQAGFGWPGQTEFFADRWGGEPTMAFVGEELRVVLATWHLPLSEVPAAVTADCLERAVRRADGLARACGLKNPRIGVCGLNPHAGEGGILGVEERDLLDPALDRLRKEFSGLSSCLPGDTVFYRQRKGEFDVTVALYHDQGLAAVKTLEFDRAVNVTLGLPFVRTSPDHGTGFDIAGSGKADSGSFLAAMRLAQRLSVASA